jgi:ketosteroid isomerase-like protein
VRYPWIALGVCLVVLASSCGGAPNLVAFQPKNQDEAVIAAQILKIPNGIKARSLDLIMQAYAEDVYIGNFHKYLGVASPGAPRSISKLELRDAYFQLFRAVKEMDMDVRDFRLTISGDRAVAEGRTELSMKVERSRGESKRPELLLNDVLWRLKRGPAGWKIQEEIFQ